MQPAKTVLRRLVARQLERRVQKLIAVRQLKVVAVTGSVGKTSTKLAVAEVLRQKYRVLVHEGNFNSEIGLPLSVFGLDVPDRLTNPLAWLKLLDRIDKKLQDDYPYDVMVLEMGADQPGDIQKFMRYITPDIGIVTAIAPVHTEQFGSIEAIAREKMALARGSRAVLLNEDNERVMAEARNLGRPVQTYGVSQGGVHFEEVRRAGDLTLGGRLQLASEAVKVQTHYVGRHSLAALAAAAAVGEELGLTAEQIKTGIEASQPFAGRMQVLAGVNETIIIDDTYNAAPTAVLAVLETLAELPGRHIAILGSMNELGRLAPRAHREVGSAAKGVDLLLTIGDNAGKYIAAGAAEAGLAASRIHTFSSPYAAGEFIKPQLKKGDVVLVKGSQNGVFAEEAVVLLLANPADRARLVRQEPEWRRRKQAQFLKEDSG